MKQWHGGNDARTSPSYFGVSIVGTNRTEIHPFHLEDFKKVLERIIQLSEIRYGSHFPDGHTSRPIIDLIYVDDESPNRRIVAYRFTSDAAYDLYKSQLIELGSSLGRGTFRDPTSDNWLFDQFLRD